jgi:hypothetical protein
MYYFLQERQYYQLPLKILPKKMSGRNCAVRERIVLKGRAVGYESFFAVNAKILLD